MRNLYYEQLQKESDGTYEKEIRADAIRKFTEWLTHNFVYTHGIGFTRLSFSRIYTIDEVIAEYEKEEITDEAT